MDAETWVIWPDGTMAQLEEVWRGDYSHMSDDYRKATNEEVLDYLGG